jgi:hypothetical protein
MSRTNSFLWKSLAEISSSDVGAMSTVRLETETVFGLILISIEASISMTSGPPVVTENILSPSGANTTLNEHDDDLIT